MSDDATTELAETDDELTLALRKEEMPALVGRYLQAHEQLEALAREAQPYQLMLTTIERVWNERLTANHMQKLPTGSDRIEVALVPGKTTITRNNPLLRDLLTEFAEKNGIALSEVQECVRIVQPPPEWHSNLTVLKAFAKDYGDEVVKIVARCISRYKGPSTFQVTIKEPTQHERDDTNPT